MNYQNISEIYDGNDSVRTKLKELVSDLTEEQLSALPEGEKWTISQIVEHISLVDEGMMRICSKLLRKAEASGKVSAGGVTISDNFVQKGAEIARIKLDAPDFVQPVNGRSIAESLAKLDENRMRFVELRPMFEQFDGTEFKFPHPFFGDISAHEWLVLGGGHQARHLKQILKLIEKSGIKSPGHEEG